MGTNIRRALLSLLLLFLSPTLWAASLYVSNEVSGAVGYYDLATGVLQGTVGTYNAPTALALDGGGNLYVTAFGEGRIYKINLATGAQTPFITVNAQDGVFALAFDSTGHAYVTLRNAGVVRKYTAGGALVGSVAVSRPRGIAFHSGTGDLYVVSTPFSDLQQGSDSVVRVTTGLAVSPFASQNLDSPRYPAIDESGRVAVSNSQANVVAFQTSGAYSGIVAALGPEGANQFAFTNGGYPLYVSQWFTNRVLRCTSAAFCATFLTQDGQFGAHGVLIAPTLGQCGYTLNPTSLTAGPGTGSYSFSVTSTSGCSWSPSTSQDWLFLTSGPGTGNGTVNFNVSANSGAARSGAITVAGRTFTVNQEAPCTYSLSTTSQSVPSAGGDYSVTLSTQPACAWSASAGASWLQLLGAASGSGTGTISYRVDPNSGTARDSILTIAGLSLSVQQQAFQPCAVTLTPPSGLITGAGGQGTFQVSAACAFSATSGSSWLQVISGGSGQGAGTVTYRADPLATGSRTGYVSVNGVLFALTQNAQPCSLDVSPLSISLPAGGGIASTTVGNPQNCAWTAVSAVPWITVTGGANGSLTGAVGLSVQPNTGAQRTGTVAVAGRTVNVVQQAGTNCPALLSPDRVVYQSIGGSGSISVNSPCQWTASSNATWLHITSGSPGQGLGSVSFVVDANTSGTARSATLTAAGQTAAVFQQGPACDYSLSAQSLAGPAAGSERSVEVSAPSGCPWSVTAAIPWVELVAGASGSGNGTVRLRMLANAGPPRNASLQIAQRGVQLFQESATDFACTAQVASAPATVRQEGSAELTSDLQVRCGGTAARAFHGRMLVRLNTRITSRVASPTSDRVDALLLVDNPSTLVPNSNVFFGTLLAADTVQFSGIPFASAGNNADKTYRIVNLRADAAVPELGPDIIAGVEVAGDLEPVSVRVIAPLVVARSSRSVETSIGAPSGTGDINLPVSFRELIANAFRVRIGVGQDPSQPGGTYNSESGYVNTALLGPTTGVAHSATRLLLRLYGVPAGVRVLAPTTVSGGAVAQLITTDPYGSSLGAVTGAAMQEMPVVSGQVSLTWEITTANPASAEVLNFSIVFRNATLAVAEQIRAGVIAGLGPLPVRDSAAAPVLQPVPRFADPTLRRPRLRPRVRGALQVPNASQLRPALLRAPTGNRTYDVPVTAANDSTETAPEFVVRGNLSAGSEFVSGSCEPGRSGASCMVNGNEVVIRYPQMGPGEQVTATVGAGLSLDAPNGAEVNLVVSSAADYSVAYDAVRSCLAALSPFAPPSGNGATGTMRVWACGAWTLSSSAPWIHFATSAGYGNAEVGYTVDANAASQARTGTVTITGGTSFTVDQPPAGSGTGLRFVPITPCRLLETRPQYAGSTWSGAYGPPMIGAGQRRTLPIAGGARCNVPASAKAFVLNVTLDTIESGTGPVDFVTVYPTGQTRPDFWTARTTTGGYIANSAIVAAGTSGSVDIYSSNNVHLLIDINGYFADAGNAAGLLFYPFGPCRAVDTRGAPYGTMAPPYGNSRMQAGETRALRMPGSPGCPGLPAASTYSLQMTLAPGAETNGAPVAFVTAWPAGQAQPPISNMNALFGYAVSNSGIVPAGEAGTISVFSYNPTNLILDVNGYFAPDDGTGRGLSYYPVTQCRALNTMDASYTGAYGGPQMTPAQDRTVALPGAPRCSGIPVSAQAFALNATAIPNGTPMPFLSMWPAGAPWPVVSQLNAFQGQTVSNSGIVPSGPNGAIQIKVNATTHAAVEVAGYFSR